MRFTDLFIRRAIATTLVMAGILIFGIISYFTLPVSNLPAVEYPTIQVSAALPGANPDIMASSVATPLEAEFSTIAGINSMSSSSSLGTTAVTLQFDLSRNIDAAAQDVQAAISRAGGNLPPNLPAPPSYSKVNPAEQPILYIAVESKTMALSELDKYAETMLAREISMITGVSRVQVYGSQKYAVRVQADPTKLASRQVDLETVRSALGSGSLNLPAGELYGYTKAYTVQSDSQLDNASQFRKLIVSYHNGSPVYLDEVANVLDSVSNDKTRFWLGGYRQQTLRATIEWSVRALEPDERRVLWRLSVFPGSFTAEAAELICGAPDGPDVLTGLIALVDRSLVRFHAAERIGDADRFDLLVPIRELATERLLEEEPDGSTLDRHADYFAQAVRLDPDGTREDRAALTAVVEAEWHNIRTALNRLHDRGGAAEELALSPMLGRSLQHLGREGTAVSLLRHAADHLDPGDDGDLALTVLIHLADIESGTGRAASAVPTLLRAHRLLERSRSPVPTVHLAALNTSMQDPCDADPALFDRAYEVCAAMPERGNLLPKWYLTELWTLAAIIAGDRQGDLLQARMLESATGRELLHLRCEIGADLSWVGRSAEAEELLAPFTDAGVRGAAYPVDRILPLMVLADIRIAAGRVAEAEDVLEPRPSTSRSSTSPSSTR